MSRWQSIGISCCIKIHLFLQVFSPISYSDIQGHPSSEPLVPLISVLSKALLGMTGADPGRCHADLESLKRGSSVLGVV
jgi:hypothetical protein